MIQYQVNTVLLRLIQILLNCKGNLKESSVMTSEKKEAETFFHSARLRYIHLLILLDMLESTFHL